MAAGLWHLENYCESTTVTAAISTTKILKPGVLRSPEERCKLTQKQKEARRKNVFLTHWSEWKLLAARQCCVVTCWSAIMLCGGKSGRKEHMEALVSTFTLLLLSGFTSNYYRQHEIESSCKHF